MIFRCLVVTLLAVSFHADQALSEDTLPSRSGQTALGTCLNEFIPLRRETEERGKLLKAAGERHASAEEACKLIGDFGAAEMKMIEYVQAHVAKCWIPSEMLVQLKNGHKNTEGMQKRVCGFAQLSPPRRPAGPVGDFDDISMPPQVR
jgi:hypothetical protein